MKKLTLTIITCLVCHNVFAANFNVIETDIAKIHQGLTSGTINCEQLISKYLERIKTYNLSLNRGAPLNAFVSINPTAFRAARKLDQTYKVTGKLIGPLHCIPTVIKDNLDSYDFPSTSGSLALLGSQPIKDAFIVNKMRTAGAIILGKTAMDEFASGISGTSSRSGRVGNAYDPNKNSGGSSAGSAVADRLTSP